MAGNDTNVRVRSSYQRTLSPGEVVFDEGEPGDHVYVIQSGEVELIRRNSQQNRVVARLGAGDFFGELGVVLGEPRTSKAVAASTTRVIALDRETLEGMCVEEPEIAIRMIRVLVSRLIEAERRLALVGADDLLRPIVRAVVRFGEPEGEGLRVGAKLRDLAAAAGLSMLEAHCALQQLFERKLVSLAEDVLTVPNRDSLSACLDAE